MPMIDQPCDWNSSDSARDEKRGPLTTTSVPPSRASPPATAAACPRGQYGSAKLACPTPSPASKKVCARPCVRSASWSGTTSVPVGSDVVSEPTADSDTTCRTPRLRSAQRLAR